MALFTHDNPVVLEPLEHRYFDTNGLEYTSWSKMIEGYKIPFDADNISFNMAGRNRSKQKVLLKEWDDNNKVACDRGDYYHDNLETYGLTGEIIDKGNETTEMFIRQIGQFMEPYYHKHFEQTMWFEEFRLAATADLPLAHKKYTSINEQWVDIFDYKTNMKGIDYISTYKKRMLYPLEHLTECKYTTYALQLSFQGYLMERNWDYKVGRLGIIYIPEDPLMWHIIPVPYMKKEVEALIYNFTKTR